MQQDEIDKIIADAVADSKKKSRHHRPKADGVLRARQILNWVFMIGFVAAVVIYFAYPDNKVLFFSVGFGSIVLKLVEFYLRFMF